MLRLSDLGPRARRGPAKCVCVYRTPTQTIARNFNGVSTDHTGAKIAQITDGTSKTILVGEKSLQPRFYDTGYGDPPEFGKHDDGDNNSMYQGYDWDTIDFHRQLRQQWAAPGNLPRQTPIATGSIPSAPCPQAIDIRTIWVAPMRAAMNMSFCDGSVQSIDYDIDPLVWDDYGGRNDEYDSRSCRPLCRTSDDWLYLKT